MTDNLVQFLRDRLDEDEQTARAATQGDWAWSREFVTPLGYHHRTIGPLEPGDAAHIARHDPARILREVEAKRRMLDNLLPEAAGADEQINDEWRAGSTLADDLLCIMALPYSDHPDYRREEWRP